MKKEIKTVTIIEMKRTIPKLKKCRECSGQFIPMTSLHVYCSVPCSVKGTQKKREEKEARAWAVKKKVWGEDLKTHSDWSKELQDEVNTIARLIDKDQPCISCQKSTGSQRHGGHRWRTSTYPEIRFNLHNIFSQCAYCNDYLSGNSDGFDLGLNIYFGKAYYFHVFSGMKINYPTMKLTIPELIQAKKRAKKIVARLKKADLTYTNEQRIELRKQINSEIGIYC